MTLFVPHFYSALLLFCSMKKSTWLWKNSAGANLVWAPAARRTRAALDGFVGAAGS